jgi:hypothetical protein
MSNWVLELPVGILTEVLKTDDDLRTDEGRSRLEKPVVIIYATKGDEDVQFDVQGFNSKEAAKSYIENATEMEEEGWELAWAFINGKRVKWTERKIFDFMEVK